LVRRGEVTVWFDEDFLRHHWHGRRTGKRGAPWKYSETAIQTLVVLKAVFGLPYRALEGFARSLMTLMKLDFPVPDHTQMSRRARSLQVAIPRRERPGPIHLVVDSTGLKIYGEGEWKVRQHGVGKRRTWRKVHLAVDGNERLCNRCMLKPIHSQSGSQEIAGGNIPVMSLNKASPSQVVSQVAGGYAVEAVHPFLQAAIVGIDVLDMINTRDDALTGCQIDWPMRDPHFSGGSSQGLCTIGAQNDIRRQKRLERSANVFLVGLLQHEVCGVSRPIPANQDRRLFFGCTVFARFSAPFAGSPLQPLPFAFLRLKEVGFVYLSDSCQAHRLLAVGQLQKPVTPTECSIGVHPNGSSTFAYARSRHQLRRVFNPLRFVPQSSQRGVGQGIEGRPARAATIPLQAVGKPPAGNLRVLAMRTDGLRGHSGFHQIVGCRGLRRRFQAIHQHLPLVRRQSLHRTRQFPEILEIHRNTYLFDSDNYIVDQHSTIT
jgi:hypothetical protein